VAGVVGGRNAGGHEVLPYNIAFVCYFLDGEHVIYLGNVN